MEPVISSNDLFKLEDNTLAAFATAFSLAGRDDLRVREGHRGGTLSKRLDVTGLAVNL